MSDFLRRLFLIFAACALGLAHAADERNLAARGGKRIALVIGNSAYAGAPLKNPVNDARDMSAALRKLGFEVIDKTDATQKDMNLAIAQFGEKLRADTVALFFFAGHGMQVKGKNYIIPIDAQISSEATVRAMTVDVDTVMDQLAVSNMNIVILDACRNNPFERRFRSVGGGLAQMDAPKGSLIAYATAPGKVANDGDGKNGLYTQELLKHIQTPGLPLEAVFKRVRNGVMQGSGDAQTPWEASSLTGDFYFLPGGGQGTQVASIAPQLAGARSAAQIEDELWDAIKDSDKAGVFEEYLKGYPKGRYLTQARVKIAALKQEARSAAVSPAPSFSASGDDPETALWKAVSQGGSGDDYDVYLKQFPKGKYVALAKQRLQKLKDEARQQAEAAEQNAWQAAEKAQTPEAYAAYAASYPGGRYAALAQVRVTKLKQDVALREETEHWDRARNATDKAVLQGYLDRYATGRYAAEARAKLDAWGFIADANGCKIFNPSPKPNETITWSGKCVNGFAEGFGRYTFFVNGTQGSSFEGTLKAGRRIGRGVTVFANGDRYEGDYANDLRSGQGVYIFASGTRYEGELRNNLPNGPGTVVVSGTSYSGNWVNGCLAQGQGVSVMVKRESCGF